MSSAVMERIVEQAETIQRFSPVATDAPATPLADLADPHPLLPIFIAGAISVTLSVLFVGSILAWIALRHSGIMAP